MDALDLLVRPLVRRGLRVDDGLEGERQLTSSGQEVLENLGPGAGDGLEEDAHGADQALLATADRPAERGVVMGVLPVVVHDGAV